MIEEVKAISGEWTVYANISYSWVPAGNAADVAAADIRIEIIEAESDGNGNAGLSAVGTDALHIPRHKRTMLLCLPPTSDHRYVILHEFGHMLGLQHEHLGFELRGVRWDFDNLRRAHPRWDEAQIRANFIDLPPGGAIVGPFNPASVMAYRIRSDWLVGGEYDVPINTALSEGDKAAAHLLYPGRDLAAIRRQQELEAVLQQKDAVLQQKVIEIANVRAQAQATAAAADAKVKLLSPDKARGLAAVAAGRTNSRALVAVLRGTDRMDPAVAHQACEALLDMLGGIFQASVDAGPAVSFGDHSMSPSASSIITAGVPATVVQVMTEHASDASVLRCALGIVARVALTAAGREMLLAESAHGP